MNLDTLYQMLAQPPQELGVAPDFLALRPRFQLHWVEQIDSTNRELATMMAAGAPAGTVLMAATQQAGRGQWGRQWLSQPGGLYLSLGLRPELEAQRSAFLTLASAWGVATSLENLGLPVQVKWPNDLVANGKKLGGLLVETRLANCCIKEAVIGLGLNSFNPVPPTGISLQQLIQPEAGFSPLNTLEGIAAVALYGLLQGYFFWQNQGDSAFLAAYQAKMTHLGQTVVVNDRLAEVRGLGGAGNLRVHLQSHLPADSIDLEVKPGEVTLGYNA
ncbi:MAG: biotin--[acetyl-CoA-carboxylase] ligase [Leptolyngbyaceae cyanobacterium SM2_5_2]|nr:biotin--[acetyl-CoA-carboxylase] ligase [Leptolyngbyaceae cyanobacterium SM2_5_2]